MRKPNTTLYPIHRSLRQRHYVPLKPQRMSRIDVPYEVRGTLMNIALSIFTDCSNVGTPFQDSLLAIYLSGLEHGATIGKEQRQ